MLTSTAVCRCIRSKALSGDTVPRSLHCDRKAQFCTILPSYIFSLKTVNMLPIDHTTFWNDADNLTAKNVIGWIFLHIHMAN